MLNTTLWVRIGAGAFVLAAIGVAALQTRQGEPALIAPLVAAANPPVDGVGPLAAALERCQGATAQPAACEPVWAENRRRFLGLPTHTTQVITATGSPALAAPAP